MLKFHETTKNVIAELSDDSFLISDPQEILDLIGECIPANSDRIIIREKNFHPDFFRLQTGLAGEILQKFSNYNFKLAVIGDFSKFKSKNLQDFFHESNKGNRVSFVKNLEEALNILK